MVEGILFLLTMCCGILIILGLILVLLGGLGALLGGAAEAYDQPKKLLYFLYFASIFLGFCWILVSLGIDLDIEQDVLQFGFLAYSSAVLFYHAMDYLWYKMGLANLSEPPKLRWAYGGANIWCSIVIQFMPDYPDADVISPAMFIFGLAIVWWALWSAYSEASE